MSFYGTLTHCKVAAVEDMRTSAVYGSGDERLGEIDEVIFDPMKGYIRHVVIDTGGLLPSKPLVLLPADKRYERQDTRMA